MDAEIDVFNVVRVTQKHKTFTTKAGNKFKKIEIEAEDEKGEKIVIKLFSDDISLGIEGVKP